MNLQRNRVYHILREDIRRERKRIGVIPSNIRTEKPDPALTKDTINYMGRLAAYLSPLWGSAAVTGDPQLAMLSVAAIATTGMIDMTRPLRDGYWLWKPKTKAPFKKEPVTPKVNWYQELQDTFDAYDIKADVVELDDSGKLLDVYALKVQKGFDIEQVTKKGANFSRDLGLAKGQFVSVEANIGNKLSAIYLPKTNREAVTFDPKSPDPRWLEFANTAELPIFFGEVVDGTPHMYDLAKCPHIFYGGETGSGKSVAINTAIKSLMSVRSPDQVRFIMIDPKRVDLAEYNNSPYIRGKVHAGVSETTVSVFDLMLKLMERRYQILEKAGVANIKQYNDKHAEPMPYEVIILEELTLLVGAKQAYAKDARSTIGNVIENKLVALTAAARACGMHFIIGVQRFDADTFKGQIRDNVPAVIGLRVRKSQSSQLLINKAGCERLLPHGDAYALLPSYDAPVRCHGAITV